MNWHEATADEIAAKIDDAIEDERGITVSPSWLRECLRERDALRAAVHGGPNDLLQVPVRAPVECVQCGSATGPLHPIDADHAGWICPKCMKKYSGGDMRTITLELDALDAEVIDTYIAEFQAAGAKILAMSGNKGGAILPEGDSNLAGAIMAECVRDLLEYRAMYDAGAEPEAR